VTPPAGILAASRDDLPVLEDVQMPTGVPGATVAVNGAANAAVLAARILTPSDGEPAECLREAKGA
jgi:5-(carboxyamino)imidazole ribonucleotide mutase